MRAGGSRGRQKTHEKGVVRGVSKTARRMAAFPPGLRQDGREVGGAAGGPAVLGDVITERVERDKQKVVRADDVVRINSRGLANDYILRDWSMRMHGLFADGDV